LRLVLHHRVSPVLTKISDDNIHPQDERVQFNFR
jgi:hypothetical protein